jgi:hypothetical protein
MAFDIELYKQIISTTNNEIINGDESIWKEANEKVANFLEDNTDIDDSKKAEYFSSFLTEVTKITVQQILENAKAIVLEYALREQQIASMQAEDARKDAETSAIIDNINSEIAVRDAQSEKDLLVKDQQITSMIEQDKARNADVAAKVAEIKYKIEHLYPSELEVALKEIEVKTAEVSLRTAQAQSETARTKLLREQVEVEKTRIEVMKDEMAIKKEAHKLEEKRVELAEEEINAKKDVYGAEARLKSQQADAVMSSLATNWSIEELKANTQKEVAYIYATGGVK